MPSALGGWALNGTVTLQSGPVLSWGNLIHYGGPLDLTSHQPDGVAFGTISTQSNTPRRIQVGARLVW